MGAGGSSGTVRQVPPPQNGAVAESTVVCVQPKAVNSGIPSEPSEPEPESPRQEMRPQVVAWGDTSPSQEKQDPSPKTASADKTGKEPQPFLRPQVGSDAGHRPVESRGRNEPSRTSTPLKAAEANAPGGTHLQGFSNPQSHSHSSSEAKGALRAGQAVRIVGLENATYLNGRQGVLRCWDPDLGRWVVRLGNGEDKGIRTQNLAPVHGPGKVASSKSIASDSMSEQANKELEGLLLQTNWSAIYQLFYQRFGITVLERLERGYAVKAAVEMSLSIVAKCFALLRSDPGGRLHCTPLHIAALQSSTEAAEVIVRDLPKLVEQTHKPSHSALCPLHIAILCGSQAIVELLLEGQADANVRTLHDVCPMHLAATTSKELCQVLLSYSAEPMRRDVMGSTVVHYATAFKQQAVVEFLLGNAPSPARLASEGDQKRVTPLHISCALYTGEEDMATPMMLLANGAKPWQADVSGASARDVVPWSQSSALVQFFETNGDRAQAAAAQWIEQRKPTSGHLDAESESSSDEGDGEGSNRASSRMRKDADLGASAEAAEGAVEGSPSKSQAEVGSSAATRAGMGMSEQHGSSSAIAPTAAAAEAAASEAKAEIERLRAEHAAEVERLKQELAQSAEKYARLEQSSANQQRNFEALQRLGEETQNQHKSQLEDIQRRQAQERADWEAQLRSQLNVSREEARAEALKEAQQENAAQIENLKASFTTQREELQAQLREAEAARDAAVEGANDGGSAPPGVDFGATLNGFGKTLGKITEDARSGNEEEFKEQIRELTEELERLEKLHEEEQAQRQSERETMQDQLHKVQEEAALKRASYAEVQNELQRVSDESKREIAGLQGLAAANQEQVRSLQEEATQLRARRTEAEDRCQQLAQEKQNAESRLSAERIAFETKMQEANLQAAQAAAQERSEAEAAKLRAEAAVAQAEQMQPLINRLTEQLKAMEEQFAEEQRLRKKYHNQIQDMKGAIRVFCRFRPLVKREVEAGDNITTKKLDAFTVQVARPERESHGRGRRHEDDSKPFTFDSVFDSDSTQDEVFADCRELVQSAVDGYNVTIFAYGQTGAGKTFTMYGNEEHPGLAPRSIHALFDVIQRESKRAEKTFKVRAYMIEVYKQDILDLLVDHRQPQRDEKGKAVHLEVKRDMARGMMYVENVTEREISSPEELMATLAEGEKRRHVTATRMNAASSRSHFLLSIIIECTNKESEQVIYGKITLCDLAGSERPKKSEVSGDALKEAIEINKSLSALGDVIEALTKGAKSVPYRNHKLTMLMQDSLGGTAKTLMFVNCSPANSNSEETLMSLKWASRARQITNDVKRHADSREVARLKQVIAMMSQAQNAQEATDAAEPAEGVAMRAGLEQVS